MSRIRGLAVQVSGDLLREYVDNANRHLRSKIPKTVNQKKSSVFGNPNQQQYRCGGSFALSTYSRFVAWLDRFCPTERDKMRDGYYKFKVVGQGAG